MYHKSLQCLLLTSRIIGLVTDSGVVTFECVFTFLALNLFMSYAHRVVIDLVVELPPVLRCISPSTLPYSNINPRVLVSFVYSFPSVPTIRGGKRSEFTYTCRLAI